MDTADLNAVLTRAIDDDAAAARREALCRSLGSVLSKTGDVLWVGGYLLGPDRAAGSSPFGFGNDATVGLATVIQIAGQLIDGAIALLDRTNVYGAAALIRQLVEAEYLAWAFAEDEEQARTWLRATREERLKFWQPRDLRRRSGGRFRSTDYASHCERGGHPTPAAMRLLPDHGERDSVIWWWVDLALHGVSTWKYVTAELHNIGWAEQLEHDIAGLKGLASEVEQWRRHEPLMALIGTVTPATRVSPGLRPSDEGTATSRK